MPSDPARRLRYSAPPVLGRSDVAPLDPAAESFLAEAEIGQGWLMPGASNHTFLVELCSGSKQGYGIYKPQAGEAPLWDFPDGTLYRRECAAYVASRLLDWPLVPPTVLREGELGVGSLQLYVPPQGQTHYFTLRDEHLDEVFRMAVFDVVVNNADRKSGHCFLGRDGGIWGIDHGLTFHIDRKLRTVIWDFGGERVPTPLLDDLHRLADDLEGDTSTAAVRLAEWLVPREVEALRRRIRALLHDPIMPEPRTRRDIPWPWL